MARVPPDIRDAPAPYDKPQFNRPAGIPAAGAAERDEALVEQPPASRAGNPGRLVDAGQGDKEPRTERGRKTLRRLIEAAAAEFGERGFHEAAITEITHRGRSGARHLLHLFREQGGGLPGAHPRHQPGRPGLTSPRR